MTTSSAGNGSPAALRGGSGVQASLWDVEPPLSELTFCIVDLETSGTSPHDAEITEFGAVKVRAGEVLGEFSSFVRINAPLSRDIVRLTGITDADLAPAPPIGEVFPAFLEFASGCVLVAHNARFDIAFLQATAARLGYNWDFPAPLCTLQLARRILGRGETQSFRLGDLARFFHAETTPNHRALADARATVDVLHGLIARVGNCGVATLGDLRGYDRRLPEAARRKATLTDTLPDRPGVYIFRDEVGTPLYIGSSVNVRARARTYFTGGDPRGRMRTMVTLAARIDHVECANDLEAWLREDQLIDSLQPPFNRRSKRPRRGWWLGVKETGTSPAPADAGVLPARIERLPFADSVGPFRTRREAQDAARVYGCTSAAAWARLCAGSDCTAVFAAVAEVQALAAAGHFEHAAARRDEIAPAVSTLSRMHSLAPIARCPEMVLAQRLGRSWTFVVVRHGRLAAAGTLPRGADHSRFLAGLRAQAQHIDPEPGPYCGATPAQLSHIARWMDARPTRIVSLGGQWIEPAGGTQGLDQWATTAAAAAREARKALGTARDGLPRTSRRRG